MFSSPQRACRILVCRLILACYTAQMVVCVYCLPAYGGRWLSLSAPPPPSACFCSCLLPGTLSACKHGHPPSTCCSCALRPCPCPLACCHLRRISSFHRKRHQPRCSHMARMLGAEIILFAAVFGQLGLWLASTSNIGDGKALIPTVPVGITKRAPSMWLSP
jgi:hypothetical protein